MQWYAVIMKTGELVFSTSALDTVSEYYRYRWIARLSGVGGFNQEGYFDGDTEELLAVASLVRLPQFPK